jgi:replicative DNA helicase
MNSAYSLEAENSVLGSILLDASVFPGVREALTAEDFSNTVNKAIYKAAEGLFNAGKVVDPVSIKRAAEAILGGSEDVNLNDYMLQLLEITPTAANVSEYVKLARDASMRRQLIEIARKIETYVESYSPPREVIASAQKALQGIESNERNRETISFSDALTDFLVLQDEIQTGVCLFIKTEYKYIDRVLGGGLLNSGFYLLAGRPGMGKTTLGLNIVRKVAKKGLPVLFVSLEMSKEQITQKLLALETGLSTQELVGKMDAQAVDRVTEAVTQIHELPLTLNQKTDATVSDIANMARAVKGLALICVDYVGLIEPDDKRAKPYEGVSQVSRDLKRLAMRLNIPILGLAQLNREVTGRSDKRPLISDLRDSGRLEQDANGIILLHRPDYYDPNYKHDGISPVILEVDIAKNRHGPTGKVTLDYYLTNGRIL